MSVVYTVVSKYVLQGGQTFNAGLFVAQKRPATT